MKIGFCIPLLYFLKEGPFIPNFTDLAGRVIGGLCSDKKRYSFEP